MARQHRHFYINGKKEFSLFFKPEITDKEEIMKKFTEDSLWKWYLDYYKSKLISYEFNDNMTEVYIKTVKK